MTPLEQYPQLRKALYTVQWVANLALGILAVVFTAKGESPQWLIIAGLVGNFVWTYTGLTASGNVTQSDVPPRDQRGAVDVVTVLVIAVLVVLLLVLLGYFR